MDTEIVIREGNINRGFRLVCSQDLFHGFLIPSSTCGSLLEKLSVWSYFDCAALVVMLYHQTFIKDTGTIHT